MAYPRQRNDSFPTVYHVTNALVGEAGELVLDERQMGRLSLMIRQADRLFCVNVISFEVGSTGYSLVCSAPAEMPSRDELRERFWDRYGKRREMPDFDDPDVYSRWAARLRDFSCLVKDIQQRFTQWYNGVERSGRRKGTLWKSRFHSCILRTARKALATVKNALGKTARAGRLRKLRGQRWRKTKSGYFFLRDAALPVLVGGVTFGAGVAYVLLDEFSQIPQVPFPLKILRDIVRRSMWKWLR